MKKSKDIIPYIVIFLLALYIWKCSGGKNPQDIKPTIISVEEVVDTVYPEPIIIEVDTKVPVPTKVTVEDIKRYIDGTYVSKDKVDILEEHIDFLENNIDSLNSSLKIYSDSFSDENITIYTSNVVIGKLESQKLNYLLKVPKIIEKTKTITLSTVEKKNKLFLTSGIGGNKEQFNFDVGLMLINKKDKMIGYEYDPIIRTHQIKIGLKIL